MIRDTFPGNRTAGSSHAAVAASGSDATTWWAPSTTWSANYLDPYEPANENKWAWPSTTSIPSSGPSPG